MRRLLTYLLAVPVMAATVGAALAANTPNLAVVTNPPKQLKNTTVNSSKQKRKPSKPYQIGTASWYGRQFHGKTTASGEPFNMFNLTAAHRTLPLGTWVKVTNLRNGASVIVRINDRGPVPESRIIDLSYEAATMLELRAYGLQRVRLDIAGPETIAAALRAEQVN